MEESTIVKTGHDPKNREVIIVEGLRKKVKVWQVEKPDTQFVSRSTNSFKIAVDIFEEQITCSQN